MKEPFFLLITLSGPLQNYKHRFSLSIGLFAHIQGLSIPKFTTVSNCVWSSGMNFEAPKSNNFTMWVLSSGMFEDFTSLLIIGGEAAKCNYDSCSAVSVAILRRISHDTMDFFCMYSKWVPLDMNL